MNELNLAIGTHAEVFTDNADETRVERQNRKSLRETKSVRRPENSNKLKKINFLKSESLRYAFRIAYKAVNQFNWLLY